MKFSRQAAFASLIALSSSFPAAAQNAGQDEAFVKDGQQFSRQMVDGRELNTRCTLAYNEAGQLTPEFIEKLDTGFFHGGQPGMVALYLGPEFSLNAAIRNAPPKQRVILEGYARDLNTASSDVERAHALKKVLQFSHGEALDEADYFRDLEMHCQMN